MSEQDTAGMEGSGVDFPDPDGVESDDVGGGDPFPDDDDGDVDEPAPPLWVWDGLDDELYQGLWREFAAWVRWLEDAYGTWVELPPCWPLHEALREELRLFWYWHTELMTTEDSPVTGIAWHNDLRQSAQAWRELASCEHAEQLRYHRQLAEQRRSRHEGFLEQAIATRSDAGWRHDGGEA